MQRTIQILMFSTFMAAGMPAAAQLSHIDTRAADTLVSRAGVLEAGTGLPADGTRSVSRAVAQQAPQTPSANRRYNFRVHGGMFSGFVTTGVGFGGGIASRPFEDESIEVQGDFSYAHLGGWSYRNTLTSYEANLSLYQGSGNVLYNFVLDDQAFTPYAGAGLVYSSTQLSAKGTSTLPFSAGRIEETASVDFVSGLHLQLVGGMQWPISGGRALRAELRAGFPGLLLLAGVSF